MFFTRKHFLHTLKNHPHSQARLIQYEMCSSSDVNILADWDECSTDPCGNNTQCFNVQGSFVCRCVDGFVEDESSGSESLGENTSCSGALVLNKLSQESSSCPQLCVHTNCNSLCCRY